MKERPILFSAPMVCALLAGAKTQTRRIMKPQPSADWVPVPELIEIHGRDRKGELNPDILRGHGYCSGDGEEGYECGYGRPGDLLWVRETFGYTRQCDDINGTGDVLAYRAGGAHVHSGRRHLRRCQSGALMQPNHWYDRPQPWKPSIHMPRWASRISLEITNVRVQRLQDISEEDARAEGIRWTDDGPLHAHIGLSHVGGAECNFSTAKLAYSALWDDINGDMAWAANPWVWALTFKRVTTESTPTKSAAGAK